MQSTLQTKIQSKLVSNNKLSILLSHNDLFYKMIYAKLLLFGRVELGNSNFFTLGVQRLQKTSINILKKIRALEFPNQPIIKKVNFTQKYILRKVK